MIRRIVPGSRVEPRLQRLMDRSLLVLSLLCLAFVSGCAGGEAGPAEESRRWLYQDLLTAGVFDDQLAQSPRLLTCDDETAYALSIRDGDVLEAEVELGGDVHLQLSGCTRRWGDPSARGELHIDVETEDGRALRETLSVLGQPGWWQWTTDLQRLEGARAVLRLKLDLRPGQRLHLKDIVIRQRVSAPPPPPPEAHQILLISVDTLRADSIGGLGGWGRTPHLDEFLSDAQAWQPHYAGSTWTQPSHATLLTGFDFDVHRVDQSPLPAGLVTLAEHMQDAGLQTWGLVHDCVWLDPKFDFDRGFEAYRSVPWQLEPMNRELMNWLGAHRDQPFFAFFHTFEAHSDFHRLPYESPGTRSSEIRHLFLLRKPYPCDFGEPCASLRLKRIRDGRVSPLPTEAQILEELYRRGVEHADRQLGRLFQHLKGLGLYDRMLIVLTSDHGEMLLEHGTTLHGLPWQQVTQVPLLIKWPGGRFAGERRQVPSGAVDLLPTLLQAVGQRLDSDLQGVPLLSRRADRPVFNAMMGFNIVWADSYKAILPRQQGAPPSLYDLRVDPLEAHDLSSEQPEVLDRLQQLLQAHQAESERLRSKLLSGSTDGASLTQEERERLESLGYGG